MKYFHRTHVSPDQAIRKAAAFFAPRLPPVEEGARRRRFAGPIGRLTVTVLAEGGHYTLVTVETDQPGESEIDKLAKRFLAVVHTMEEPTHVLRGSY
ncbi:MAG: hypothetical protein HOP28_07475 [Gemmatimonadales bacterium]|nr:hypothetical protein [Gemmatimonadales bacterium]